MTGAYHRSQLSHNRSTQAHLVAGRRPASFSNSQRSSAERLQRPPDLQLSGNGSAEEAEQFGHQQKAPGAAAEAAATAEAAAAATAAANTCQNGDLPADLLESAIHCDVSADCLHSQLRQTSRHLR